MANTTSSKLSVNRATALSTAIEVLRGHEGLNPDVIVSLERMLASIQKSSASKTPSESKVHIQNVNLSKKVVEWAKTVPNNAFTNVMIRDTFSPDIISTQKASKIMGILLNEGMVAKEVIKGTTVYHLI